MKSLTLARFDPEPPDEPTRWQIGYDVVLDDGRELHSVTTVYRTQVPSGSREEILAVADAAILPGLILQDRQIMPGLLEIPPPFEPPSEGHGAEVGLPDAAGPKGKGKT